MSSKVSSTCGVDGIPVSSPSTNQLPLSPIVILPLKVIDIYSAYLVFVLVQTPLVLHW